MCQDTQKVTFYCGHQVIFWYRKSRFCLFTGEGKTRFHTTYQTFESSQDNCKRCKISSALKARGKKMNGTTFKDAVEKQYAGSADGRFEKMGTRFESQLAATHGQLTSSTLAELHRQIQERIVFYIDREKVSAGAKVALLRTITRLNDVFDRRALVLFFASRYFAPGDAKRTMKEWERRELFNAVRRVRLERTFKEGLALTVPVPVMVPESCDVQGTGSQDSGPENTHC